MLLTSAGLLILSSAQFYSITCLGFFWGGVDLYVVIVSKEKSVHTVDLTVQQLSGGNWP